MLSEKHSPNEFLFKKSEKCVISYHLTIKIDRQLHVQLQFNGNSIPLPP